MESLEEIRKRKLEELQAKAQQNVQEDMQLQQELQQLEAAVKGRMTKEALLRFGSIKTADPERAVQVLVIMGQLLQQGRVTQIDDNLFKQVLLQVTPKKRDFHIRVK